MALDRQRIENLDAVRFVAAAWVAISHGALPFKSLLSDSDPGLRLIAGALTSTFNGQAAVMVFFIVSGLCIHWPNIGAHSLRVGEFLARRYLRIGVPLVAILIISHAIGTADAISAVEGVLWSLYAELVYYTLYPVLFYASKITGWSVLLIVSGLISTIMALAHIDYSHAQAFGWSTWLWALSVWLSGCALAESLRDRARPTFPGPLPAWRLAIWGAGAAAVFALYHLPIRIGGSVSLLVFSVLAYFWLENELQNSVEWPPVLNKLGAASYSLYLVHGFAIEEVNAAGATLGPVALLGLRLAMIAAATWGVYWLIEYPSHSLARRAGRWSFAPAWVASAK